MKKQKRIVPNVIRGGVAIPLGANYFLMKGKTHEQGGIDIGKDLEVENGELMKIDKNNMTIISNAPIMNGISPAEYALGGLKDGTFTDRFKEGFKYQEKYKDINSLKDDGTKAKFGKDFKVPKIYLRTEDVFDEIDNIIYNNKNPKDLAKALDEYWSSIENNVSIPVEFKQNIKQDLEHYKKYPYASSLITRNRIDDQKRYEKDESLRIPADYSKMITLSEAGKSTGITVTKNMLDSLAYRGGRAQADTVRVLGVPAQETGLGKFEGTTYITPRQIRQDEEYYKIDRSENPSYFIREGGVNPTELMNNHYYYASSADQEALGAISRKTGAGHDTSNGNIMANIGYNEITPEVEEEAKKTWRYTTNKRAKENLDVHPLEQAYELDKTGNYNLGISNHNTLVQTRGEELWNSPEIQQWWEESGKQWYEKGAMETKQMKMGAKEKLSKTSDKIKQDLRAKAAGVKSSDIYIKRFNGGDFGGAGAGSYWDDKKAKAKNDRRRKYYTNVPSTGEKKKAELGLFDRPGVDDIVRSTLPAAQLTIPTINSVKPVTTNILQGRLSFADIIKNNFGNYIFDIPTIGDINFDSAKYSTPTQAQQPIVTPVATSSNKQENVVKNNDMFIEPVSKIIERNLTIPNYGLGEIKEQGLSNREFSTPQVTKKQRTPLTSQQKEELISSILEGGSAALSAGMLAATTATNAKMLNRLEEYKDPVYNTRQRLKTTVNRNPQLAKAKKIFDKTNKFILHNTSSSKTAYDRIRQNNLDYISNLNDIYSEKENTETSLLNQDITAENENTKYNNTLKNQIDLANTELRNAINEKKSENKAALYQGISDIVANMVTNYGKRKQNNKNLRVMAAGFPSITPEHLNSILYK